MLKCEGSRCNDSKNIYRREFIHTHVYIYIFLRTQIFKGQKWDWKNISNMGEGGNLILFFQTWKFLFSLLELFFSSVIILLLFGIKKIYSFRLWSWTFFFHFTKGIAIVDYAFFFSEGRRGREGAEGKSTFLFSKNVSPRVGQIGE